jgi:monolysocardiolipin acyltransferase
VIINNNSNFSGMDSVLPNEEPYVPQIGKKVSIYIGEPLIFDDLVQKMKKENRSLVRINK